MRCLGDYPHADHVRLLPVHIGVPSDTEMGEEMRRERAVRTGADVQGPGMWATSSSGADDG